MISIFVRNKAGKPSRKRVPEKSHSFWKIFLYKSVFWGLLTTFLVALICYSVFWSKNDTERIWDYLKRQVLKPTQMFFWPKWNPNGTNMEPNKTQWKQNGTQIEPTFGHGSPHEFTFNFGWMWGRISGRRAF